MNLIRRFFHALLLTLSLPFLLLSAGALGLFTGLAVLADRMLPNARFGNCFTFAAARWARHDGYVSLRSVDGVTFLGLPIPHAIWQSALDGVVRMTYPVKRLAGWWPWFVLLFRYEVWCGDSPRDLRYIESEVPTAWQPTQPE